MAGRGGRAYTFHVPARTFRTRLSLRLAVAAAGLLWAGVLVVLLLSPGAGPEAIFGAAVFTAFFSGFSFVYRRTTITVTKDGIVATAPLRRPRTMAFRDILEVVVQDGLAGRVYAICTRAGLVHFTSLFGGHLELFELIRERAALAPRGR